MFSGLVLSEAVLSWLGIGVDGSWGQMIDGARNELSRDPIIWWNIASGRGTALFGLILAVNAVGDAIRDVLDPRTLRRRTRRMSALLEVKGSPDGLSRSGQGWLTVVDDVSFDV